MIEVGKGEKKEERKIGGKFDCRDKLSFCMIPVEANPFLSKWVTRLIQKRT